MAKHGRLRSLAVAAGTYGFLVVLAVAGCAPRSSDRDGGIASVAKPVQPLSSEHAQMIGIWRSNCMDASDAGLSQRERVEFTESRITRWLSIGSSGDCSTEYISATLSGHYSVSVVSSGALPAIDFAVEMAVVRPLDVKAAGILNLARTCGLSDWRVNEERNVTERIGVEDCFARYPKAMYTSYEFKGGALYFGSGVDFASEGKRPREIDTGIAYSKE